MNPENSGKIEFLLARMANKTKRSVKSYDTLILQNILLLGIINNLLQNKEP